MAVFNILHATLKCPHCNCTNGMEIEFRFGWRNLDHYQVGDTLTWADGDRHPPEGRPEHGNYIGEGYTECPHCHKDFWTRIHIEDDQISSVKVDLQRQGYIG